MTTKFLSAVAASVILLPSVAIAEIVQDIIITGNQRVDEQSVRSYLDITEGAEYDSSKVNSSVKALFKTGLFSDINVTKTAGIVTFKVAENPIISQVAFEGNQSINDEKLKDEVTLDSRSIYTKAAVQDNVQRIANIYSRSGRFNAKVEPKVILKDQNRVDLVFEIDEGEKTEIRKVVFLGNENFSDGTLQDEIKSVEAAWYHFLSSNDVYDADRVEFDKELLRRFYTKNGFADFKVNSAVAELTPNKDGFIITYSVDEGPRYQFGKVQVITQLDEIDTSKFDEEVVESVQGEEYDSTDVEDTIDNLTEKAGEKGFAFVEVDPQLSRDKENNIIDVTYVMKEGPKVYVDRININGNSRTLDKVLRREMKLSEGDPFNTSKLKRSRQRLQNLDFFKAVEVNQERGTASDKIDINVDVEEKSTGEINFGAGFSTIDGVLGEVSVSERNLLGRGQNLRVSLTASGIRQQGQVSFTEPYFMGKDLSAGFDLFRIQRDQEFDNSFDSQSTGFALRAGYDIFEHLTHTLRYSIIEDVIEDVEAGASAFIAQQEGTNLSSAIGHTFLFDHRDDRKAPKEGYVARLQQSVAGLGGDSKFIKHQIDAAYYYPLTEEKDWGLSFISSAGNITGLGEDVRINERFYVGGKNFRGFAKGGIGPRDVSTDDVLGGNSFYVLTAELGFPLTLSEEYGFTGALFTDIGSLTGLDDNGANIVDSEDPRVSVGVGLGWNSPFGPLRVDFGFPVVKDDNDEEENFQLNFGTRF